MTRRPGSRLLHSALTLTAAAVAARILGLVYRMLLARWLGAEGLGVFQLAFPLYLALVTWVAGGMPVAVSQVAAEGHWMPEQISGTAMRLTLGAAAPAVAFLILLAGPLAQTVYRIPAMGPLIVWLAPAVVAVAGSSVLRGVFVGRQTMRPPAWSQMAEQGTRVVALLTLLTWFTGVVPAARPLYAIWLVGLGETVSWCVLLVAWRRLGHDAVETRSKPSGLSRRLVRLAWPVTVGRLMGSGLSLLEALLIPRWLMMTGMGSAAAIAWLGKLMGMAVPLILFPTAVTASVGTTLVPAVAEVLTDPRRVRHEVFTGIRATALWSCLVSALLVVVGPELDDVLFHTNLTSVLFLPLTLGGFFLYFDMVFSGALRGLGHTEIPLRNDLAASLAELGLLALLVLGLRLGPMGVTVAVGTGFLLAAGLNYRDLQRLLTAPVPWGSLLLPPLLAAAPIIPLGTMVLAAAGPGTLGGVVLVVALGSAVYYVGLHLLMPTGGLLR